MTIRRIEAEDRAAMEAFFDQMGGETRAYFNRNDNNRIFCRRWIDEQPADALCWAAFEDGVALGYVFFYRANTCLPYLGVAVREDGKGRGLGLALINFALEEAKRFGASGVALTVSAGNARAQALYEKVGFVCDGMARNGEFLYLLCFPREMGADMPADDVQDGVMIRAFRPDDEARVTRFFDQMGGETRAFFNRGECNRRNAAKFFDGSARNAVYWLAEQDGEMVGYVFLYHLDEGLPVLGISVSEGFKGRHLGRRLIVHARAYALENRYGGIRLACFPSNVRAQALYERMGFAWTSNRMNELTYQMVFPRAL